MSVIFTEEGLDCLRKARSLIMRAVAVEGRFAERMAVITSLVMSEEEFNEKNTERALELALITGKITTLIDSLTGEH